MLFEGWELQFTDAWKFHPFHGPNNVNGIDADPDGRGSLYNQLRDDPMGKKVLAFQEAYVRKVIDTVNDLDNVLYEVCNEAGAYSTAWQYHVIDFVHEDEAGRPKQHPVGMTFMYPGGTNRQLIDSPADWISPNPGTPEEDYKDRPSARYVGKVIVNDTDHLWGHTGGDSVWVWKSFLRGLNVLFMEELTPSPTWQDSARVAMGQVRAWAGEDRPGPHGPRARAGPDRIPPGPDRGLGVPGLPGRQPGRVLDRPEGRAGIIRGGVVRHDDRQGRGRQAGRPAAAGACSRRRSRARRPCT